jgi:hypothetical protein
MLISFSCSIGFSQGELDEQEKIFYRNERTFAGLLNSNGIGANFRYAKRIDGFRKTLYEAEINYLKHPKEKRITITETNRSIIYGKLNSVFTIKGAIGNQKELFQKRDLGSISIRRFFNIGTSLAFLKPVYYEYYVNNGYEYDKFLGHGFPIGRAPFTMGFNELSVSPGLYGKFGFTFEYSRIDEIFHALEIGIAFDAYVRQINIMSVPTESILYLLPDNHFIPTLFISYRFGKVISSRFNTSQSVIDELLIE